MKNNRLTRLIHILDTAEKRKLRQLLETSGKDKDMSVLFNYLIKYSDSEKRLDKERVFKAVYPKDAFDAKKMSRLNAQLYRFAEDFIITQQLNKKDHAAQRQFVLLEYLSEKKLPDNKYNDDLYGLTERTIHDLEGTLSRTESHDLLYYLNRYRLNTHLYHFNTNKWQKGQLYIESLMENLDTFYCLAKLRYANELFMRERILNEDSRVLLLDELYGYGARLQDKGVYQADIYRLSLDLLQGFDENKFHRLKEQTFKHADTLEQSELSEILIFLGNHAAKATRRGDANLVVANYEIYNLGFEKEAFIEKGFITTPLLLVNYASLCSEVGKMDEIDAVLNQYQDKIKESEKEDTHILCQAYQYFGNGDYRKAYQLVDEHSKKTLSFGLHQKSLQLKCLYELEDSSIHLDPDRTLYDACAAYRRYIQRKSDKLNTSTSDASLNFVNILLKLGHPDTTQKELEQMIATGHATIHRNWLTKKIQAKK